MIQSCVRQKTIFYRQRKKQKKRILTSLNCDPLLVRAQDEVHVPAYNSRSSHGTEFYLKYQCPTKRMFHKPSIELRFELCILHLQAPRSALQNSAPE